MEVNELKVTAREIRKDIIKMIHAAGSGHPAGALGMADVFTVLFFGDVMRFDSKNPNWAKRDRFVLSNGHICPVLYSAMARAGYFPVEKLLTLREFGSNLQGHPHRGALPGLETSSGPLGSGLSQAAGMALAGKSEGAEHFVFCVGSDGEHDEGNWWEAVMFAAKYKLGNMVIIVDRNMIQIDGYTEDVMPLGDLVSKYEAFGWHAQEINGHDFFDIARAINVAKKEDDRPSVIIARTLPGKGVSFMENNPIWHGKAPNDEEARSALQELDKGVQDG